MTLAVMEVNLNLPFRHFYEMDEIICNKMSCEFYKIPIMEAVSKIVRFY